MQVNDIATLISAVGFPIVACCAMFYLYNKQIEVVNDLKVVLTKLLAKLDADKNIDID